MKPWEIEKLERMRREAEVRRERRVEMPAPPPPAHEEPEREAPRCAVIVL